MRRGGRVNGQALGVTYVCEVRQTLQVVDKLGTGSISFDSEYDHRSPFSVQVLLVKGIHRVILETGETNPLDRVVEFQMLGHGQ